MAIHFNATVNGGTDDDVIIALELIIEQIRDGFTSGLNLSENRDYRWSMGEPST